MDSTEMTSLVFLLIWAWAANAFAYNKGFYSLPERNKDSKDLGISNVLGVFGLFLFVQLVVVPSGLFVYSYFQTGVWKIAQAGGHGWTNIIAIVTSGIGLVLYCTVIAPKTANIIFVKDYEKFKKDIQFGMLSWLVCFPIVSLVAQIFSSILVYFDLSKDVDQVAVHYLKQILSNRPLFWTSFWMIIFIVPFIEELLFRGFLQNWLRQKMPALPAIAITSFIFAGFHFSASQGWRNVDLGVALFLLSFYMGLLNEKRGSIWAPIGLHMTFNAISEVVIVFQEGGFSL